VLFGAVVFGVKRIVPIGAPWSIIVAAMQPASDDALHHTQASQAPQGEGMNKGDAA
jgi:hypothetical protein